MHILFVCTGNTGRSIAAEAIARAYAAKTQRSADFASRGLDVHPDERQIEAHFRRLLMERGIDLSAHRAEPLTAGDVIHADLVLTMTHAHRVGVISAYPDAKSRTFMLAEYATGNAADVDDAHGKPLEFYRNIFASLDRLVTPAVDKVLSDSRPQRS